MNASSLFEDAHALHRANPDTFEIPSNEELLELKAGSSVKVCFGGERFWVKLTEPMQRRTGTLTGMINNVLLKPESRKMFPVGMVVFFSHKNVYSIYDQTKAFIEYYMLNYKRGILSSILKEQPAMKFKLAEAILKTFDKQPTFARLQQVIARLEHPGSIINMLTAPQKRTKKVSILKQRA